MAAPMLVLGTADGAVEGGMRSGRELVDGGGAVGIGGDVAAPEAGAEGAEDVEVDEAEVRRSGCGLAAAAALMLSSLCTGGGRLRYYFGSPQLPIKKR